ncbi:LysR family transcriptional regulator [Marinobacterium arenosum]|uniref:LysR family transcriptional regulator n=1 Tax=Marinobacterium arenosum TaxID=2862496 RepID=UPI001C946E9E|nr:LysR family transcriptional regulator [Marinobacterium arenosum]MBY4677934.1 LysR family transcriptional regulator [Marinobacterium arenosum]
MTLDELAAVDLKLLVAFNALMEEHSVSRAAERLNLSQPSMSRTLQRLRRLFADELFVRQSHGLAPSPRAEQLHRQLRPLLDDMLRLVAPVVVEPSRMARTFRIAAIDILAQQWIGPLLNELQRQAPGVRLRISNLEPYSMDELVGGQLDFLISLNETAPANVHARVLGHDTPVCLLHRDHPLAAQELTRERFLRLPFVHFLVPGFDERLPVDRELALQGEQRRILLQTNNLISALNAVRHSGMALLSGRRISECLPGSEQLVAKPLPFHPHEGAAIRLFWHRRYHDDVEHRWLRELIDRLFWPTDTGNLQVVAQSQH